MTFSCAMQNTAHLLPPTFLKHPRLGAVAWVSLPLPLLVGGQGGGKGGATGPLFLDLNRV